MQFHEEGQHLEREVDSTKSYPEGKKSLTILSDRVMMSNKLLNFIFLFSNFFEIMFFSLIFFFESMNFSFLF